MPRPYLWQFCRQSFQGCVLSRWCRVFLMWMVIQTMKKCPAVTEPECLYPCLQNATCGRHLKRRRTYWVCHVLRRNCLLKHVIEGKIEWRRRRRGRRAATGWPQVKEKTLELGGSTRSHSLENSLWKRHWTCRNTNHAMNEHCLDQLDHVRAITVHLKSRLISSFPPPSHPKCSRLCPASKTVCSFPNRL
jgi:hypothetical protein